MIVRSIALFIFILFSAPLTVPGAQAKGWRGIVPLHSTRAEVERLLGPPTEQRTDYSVLYRTENETLIINYARGLPCGIGQKYGQWRVPRDTVESILITPNMGSPLSQLSIDESKYKKRSGGHRSEDVYYINDEDGESLRVFHDRVMDITYSPAASDEHLRCAGMTGPSHNKCEGLAPPAFDTYNEISQEQEKQRLDNFVIALMDQEGSAGYIIGYGGKRGPVREAVERAQRAGNYLIKVRNFPRGRLMAINGGYREKSSVELYIVPPGGCPPTTMPTLDPKNVQILKGGKRKKNRRSS
ncbi:MAG: hypothetical protein M3R69_14545 [Acidobacteriota bacterium]|nr:hypothetical protein [Acidobacteriota bacterium]